MCLTENELSADGANLKILTELLQLSYGIKNKSLRYALKASSQFSPFSFKFLYLLPSEKKMRKERRNRKD